MKVVGLIGLGEEGYAFAQALQKRKIKILAFDLMDANRLRAANNGIVTTSSVSGVVMHLPKRKVICLLLDSMEDVGRVMGQLKELLNPKDILVHIHPQKGADSVGMPEIIGVIALEASLNSGHIEFEVPKTLDDDEKEALEYCGFLR